MQRLPGDLLWMGSLCSLMLSRSVTAAPIGDTKILKWPDGKKAAITITYDDGTKNQFKCAADYECGLAKASQDTTLMVENIEDFRSYLQALFSQSKL